MPHIEGVEVYKKNGSKKPLFVDGLLVKNLSAAKDMTKKDWDWVFVVDGIEGCGKSVLAQQLAKFCDPTLDINRICFSPDEFKKAVINCKQYQAIVYDEAYGGLNSRQAMTQTNRTIVSMLAEIRQKNLFVFIVLPTFFDLDKNVAVWRSRGLFHVEVDKNFGRGYWKFYNQVTKKYLYMKGKKFYDYRQALPNLKGRFPDGYVVDPEEYKNKKIKSLSKWGEEAQLDKQLREFRKSLVMNLYEVKNRLNLTQKDIGLILGITDRTIQNYKAEKLAQLEHLREELNTDPLKK